MLRKIKVNAGVRLFNLQQVELVVRFLHCLLPVIILVVVATSQELSRKQLRVDRLLNTLVDYWQLHR